MTNRNTRATRLERAGYRCIKDAWVPKAFYDRVMQQVAFHADDVEKAAQAEGKRGRPAKPAA